MFSSTVTSTDCNIKNAATRVHKSEQHESFLKVDAKNCERNGDDDITVSTTASYKSCHDEPKSNQRQQQEEQTNCAVFTTSDMGQAVYQMAEVRADANDWKVALPLFKEALAHQLEYLGSGHPVVAQTGRRIGNALHRVGRYKESLTVLQKVLEIHRDVLGMDENHEDIMDLEHDIWSVRSSMTIERRKEKAKEQINEKKLNKSGQMCNICVLNVRKRVSDKETASEPTLIEFTARAC